MNPIPAQAAKVRPLLIGDRHVGTKMPNKERRGFSWGRRYDADTGMVTYRLFRRGLDGQLYVEAKSFHASMRFTGDGPRPQIARVLRSMRAQLRWKVDQVDFQVLGLFDPAPPPGSAWLGGQVPPFPAPAGTEWVAGDFGFSCVGQARQDPPRLVYSGTCPLQLGGKS